MSIFIADSQLPNDIEEAKKEIEQMIGKGSLNVLINTMSFAGQEYSEISAEVLEKQFQQCTLPPLFLFQVLVLLFFFEYSRMYFQYKSFY